MTVLGNPDDDAFRAVVRGLERGDFTALDRLFVEKAGPDGHPPRILQWHAAGRFATEPKALAEALSCACFNGRVDVATQLLAHGVDPAAGNGTGLDALHWAANRGQLEAVRLLLRHGAPLETVSIHGGTVLGTAVWSAIHEPRPLHLQIIEELLVAGAVFDKAGYPTGHEDIDAVLRRHAGRPAGLESAKAKAESTYNSASDFFDAEPLAFWARTGQRTIDRLGLAPGARVLDVCCGSGASALPAARAVGPLGSVIAVDLADSLLELGRAKARAAGLRQVEFRRADMTALGFPDGAFDAAVCVFGIFFVPDMEAQVAELWRMVRPGGQLAITTWGPDIWAPAYEIFHAAVRRVRPDLVAAFNPWDRITTPEAVRKLYEDAGVRGAEVELEESWQPLRAPADFWTIALGSGLRWTIDKLGPEAAHGVQREVTEALAARGVDRVATHTVYAVARKS